MSADTCTCFIGAHCLFLVSVYEKLAVTFGKTRHRLLLSQRSAGRKERCNSLSPSSTKGRETLEDSSDFSCSHCIEAIASFSSFKV